MKKSNNHFFIIGGQRCGTTYLYTILDEHPEICMAKPLKPEPRFFLSEKIGNGFQYYQNTYFDNTKSYKAYGEKSTTYYEKVDAVSNILNCYPEAKFIMIVRDPVKRAVSNYFFSKNNGLETRSIEEVFLEDKAPPAYPSTLSTNPFDYLKRGTYIDYIKPYLKYIKKDKFKIIIFEDFVENLNSIRGLYEYLEVTSEFIPNSINRKINNSKSYLSSKEIENKLTNFYKPYNKQLSNFLGYKVFI